MNQLEAMRNVLLNAGYSREAVEAALQEPRKLRDDVTMAALTGLLANPEFDGSAVLRAMEIAGTYMKFRAKT